MSAAELNKLKLNLIAWIHQLSDVNLLSFLESLKNSESQKDWWDDLSPDQQKLILKGIRDAENGNLISSEEFLKKLKGA